MLTLSTHVSGFTLHTVIWFTLSKHMLGSKFSNFHGSFFFSYLHSPHIFQDSLCIQLLSKHMLGSKFSNFHERSFFHAYTPHTRFSVHSPYSYLVYTLQAHVRFKIFEFSQKLILFILTLSTHVSGFTLHTVIWFTLSKHMLGSKFSNFHGSFFFSYLHSPHMFQDSLCIQLLSKHMLGSKFSNFHERSFFHAYTLHTCFSVHSPYSYLVYTLQTHVRFKFFEFSQKLILFILTLSMHVSGFTLHTVIWFTLSKHMLGSKFSNFLRRSLLHAYTLHTCFRVHSQYSYLVYSLQAYVRFNIFGFSQDFNFFILSLSTHVSESSMQLFLHSPSRCYISKFYIVIIISSCA